jgi:pyruvate dehydrogenase E2 component (dihydrolipoamide acetyltransferase)
MSDSPGSAGKSPQFVDVGGHRLRHRLLSHGEEVVLMVHGFGGRLEDWSGNQAVLAAGGRTVAAIDLPGHGESSVDLGSGSLDELASVVTAYMDVMGIRRAHLVGHSMGAALSLALADHDPSRVRSLTLVGPAGIGQKINADFVRGLIMARRREEIEPLMQQLYADPARVPDERVQQMVGYKQRPGVVEALTKIASNRYAGTPSGRQLRDVAGSVPTLVIWGVADAVIPPPAPGEFVREGVLVRVLPQSGHMVQAEAADEVNRLIGEFLGG